MDISVDPTFVPVKEEEPDYEDENESIEWEEDAEPITVKVEPTVTGSGEDDMNSANENLENEYEVPYQSQLMSNFNPAQFYIAKLSHKLNSKLNKVLSPQNGNSLLTAVGPNYCGVSEENRIGGDALQCSWCPAHATNLEELKLHKLVCGLSPSNAMIEQSNLVDEDGVERRFACDICGKRFARNWFLKRHYITHTNARPFSCVVCEEDFSSAKSLKDHQITHIKDMPYICPKCNRGFPNREALKEHARVHFKDVPFSCRFCGKRFMQAKNLNFHMKVHSGSTIFPCDECEKSFETEEERSSHKKQHNVVMPYKCDVCNQAFPTKRQRQRHSDLHDLENPKKCMHCNKRFANDVSCREHIKEVHSKLSTVCSECVQHAHSVTCDDFEEFMCEDCDLPFLHKQCLANHVMDHQDEKVPCKKCGKEFPLVSAFHRHMFVHTGEFPFKCTECKDCFSTRMDLRDHMRKHWRDRPFACKVCGEKFSFNNMMAHLLSHAGGKTVLSENGNTRREGEVKGKDVKDKGRRGVKVTERGEEGKRGMEDRLRDMEDVKDKRRSKVKVNGREDMKDKGRRGIEINGRKGMKDKGRSDMEVKGRGDMKNNGRRNKNDKSDMEVDGEPMKEKEERRRSLRTKPSYSYFEGSSDELDFSDAKMSRNAEMTYGAHSD